MLRLLLVLAILSGAAANGAGGEFVDITAQDGVTLDLRYATANNFMKYPVYGDFHRCILHREAAAMFRRAVAALAQAKPGWRFRILDCMRPRDVQRKLWDRVGEMIRHGELPGVILAQRSDYVADPATGSMHNYGFAMDITLEGADGKEVDMGTGFDDFSRRAHATDAEEKAMLSSGVLKEAQWENRHVLRRAMISAGFSQQSTEWWHYNAKSKEEIVRGGYRIVETAPR